MTRVPHSPFHKALTVIADQLLVELHHDRGDVPVIHLSHRGKLRARVTLN